MGPTDQARAVPIAVWESPDRCFSACVATIADLGEDAIDDLAALGDFIHHPLAQEEYDDKLAERFGVRLRPLERPPFMHDLETSWIAVIAPADPNATETHAVVARAGRVIHDPSPPDRRSFWGEVLPTSFVGSRLVEGYEVVPA